MQHGNRDVNHVEAGQLARVHGFTTIDLGDAGEGCPDWCWGKHGLNFLVEMKRDDKAHLQPKQKQLAATWRGQWVRANSAKEAVQLAEAYVAAFKRATRADIADWNARPPVEVETAKSVIERCRAAARRRSGPRRRHRRR
jgi:hypothetical protein